MITSRERVVGRGVFFVVFGGGAGWGVSLLGKVPDGKRSLGSSTIWPVSSTPFPRGLRPLTPAHPGSPCQTERVMLAEGPADSEVSLLPGRPPHHHRGPALSARHVPPSLLSTPSTPHLQAGRQQNNTYNKAIRILRKVKTPAPQDDRVKMLPGQRGEGWTVAVSDAGGRGVLLALSWTL